MGSAAVAAAAAPPPPPNCAATFNLFIPGTWETDEKADPARPVGMLGPIAEAVEREQGAESEIFFTPYIARAFDDGHTYADSKNTAILNAGNVLRDYFTRCPEALFTITGYSQGADAAGDIASAIGNNRGPVPADRVLAVGLLSDPAAGTAGETVVGPRPVGTGIADPRPLGMGALTGRVSSICHPEDLYCAISKSDSPLFGLLGSVLSKTSRGAGISDEPGAFTDSAFTNGAFTDATDSADTDLGTLLDEGIDIAEFYASGVHGGYGSLVVDQLGRTALQWLGDWLNRLIGSATPE
ncbi:cutinase family protein [Nocardia sp. NPDC127526]|uniref:cutinase family protein n=1 Tax=Nocardia sp. NPDC127526 TaxID=3345393 RepID=UPI0036384606